MHTAVATPKRRFFYRLINDWLPFIFIGLVFLVLLSLYWPQLPFYERAFDRHIWLAGKTLTSKSSRGRMYSDLSRHHLRAGMTTNELTALLDDPDFNRKDGVWSYWLGVRVGMLNIVFTSDGRVEKWDRERF